MVDVVDFIDVVLGASVELEGSSSSQEYVVVDLVEF